MALRPTANADYADAGGINTDESYVNTTKFIPELYSKKVLRNFYEATFWKDIFNSDYEGEIKGQGSKVWIRKTPEINVNAYTIGTDLTYQVPQKAAGELVIDQAFYAAFQVDDVNKAQADLDLVNMFAKDASERIKIAVDQEVFAYIATLAHADNQGNTAGHLSNNLNMGLIAGAGASIDITSSNAIDYIVDLNTVLDEQNIPQEGRWVVLPAWYVALLKKGDLKAANITGDSTGVIRNGMIGMINGCTIYQSNNLFSATDGDAETSWYVHAGTKEACSFASQVDKVDTLKIEKSFGESIADDYYYQVAV